MRHTAHGYWLEEAGGPVAPLPPLTGEVSADVVVVGGGYAGMWTAWHLLERGATVAIVEADRCGHGPSGRNGGFVDNLWHASPRVRERFGADAALALGRASGRPKAGRAPSGGSERRERGGIILARGGACARLA